MTELCEGGALDAACLGQPPPLAVCDALRLAEQVCACVVGLLYSCYDDDSVQYHHY